MKLYKNIGTLLAASVILSQTACLKDKPNNADPSAGTNNVVEFQNTSVPVSYTSPYPQYDNGITMSSDTGSFPVLVNYAGSIATTPVDININLALNQNALDSFNSAEGTSYVIPPADTYTMVSTVTIVKGTAVAGISIKVNTAPADYDYTASYCIPLTINSASYGIISTNFGTAMYTFVANNAWTGTYKATGYFFHPSDPRSFSGSWAVTTAGQFSNTFPFGDLPSLGNPYYFTVTIPTSAGALTNYIAAGGTPASPASGFMTSDDPGGFYTPPQAPIPANVPGQGQWVSSTYNNSIDASGTFWFHIGYAGASTGQSGYTRQVYMEMAP
jgi:hypothetical protein